MLAVIPPFHSAVDRAISYLDPVEGLLGVADFYVSSRYDLPLRQMSWLRRFFWQCVACAPLHMHIVVNLPAVTSASPLKALRLNQLIYIARGCTSLIWSVEAVWHALAYCKR